MHPAVLARPQKQNFRTFPKFQYLVFQPDGHELKLIVSLVMPEPMSSNRQHCAWIKVQFSSVLKSSINLAYSAILIILKLSLLVTAMTSLIIVYSPNLMFGMLTTNAHSSIHTPDMNSIITG
jgi:hypothetical protein